MADELRMRRMLEGLDKYTKVGRIALLNGGARKEVAAIGLTAESMMELDRRIKCWAC